MLCVLVKWPLKYGRICRRVLPAPAPTLDSEAGIASWKGLHQGGVTSTLRNFSAGIEGATGQVRHVDLYDIGIQAWARHWVSPSTVWHGITFVITAKRALHTLAGQPTSPVRLCFIC